MTDPVSLLNGASGIEITTPNAVINDLINVNDVRLFCLGTPGNRDLQWEATNISNLDDGEITPEEDAAHLEISVTYVYNRSFIQLTTQSADPLLTLVGYISCKSRQSNRSSVEVFITPTNPLWRVISPLTEVVPMGAEVNITLQYGDSSVGYQNFGSGFLYGLRFLPCVATLPDMTLLMGITDELSNTVEYTFRAGLQDSGEYKWNGMSGITGGRNSSNAVL